MLQRVLHGSERPLSATLASNLGSGSSIIPRAPWGLWSRKRCVAHLLWERLSWAAAPRGQKASGQNCIGAPAPDINRTDASALEPLSC